MFGFLRNRGRLPDDLRASLEAQGVLLLDENLPGSITLRHFKAPWRRASWKKSSARVAVAILRDRLVVYANKRKWLDVPLPAPPLEVTLDEPERVCIGFDIGAYRDDASGRVELRFTTAQAQQVQALLS